MSHATLLEMVWGSEHADIQYLRVHLGQLRAKIEDEPSRPAFLVSDSGVDPPRRSALVAFSTLAKANLIRIV